MISCNSNTIISNTLKIYFASNEVNIESVCVACDNCYGVCGLGDIYMESLLGDGDSSFKLRHFQNFEGFFRI